MGNGELMWAVITLVYVCDLFSNKIIIVLIIISYHLLNAYCGSVIFLRKENQNYLFLF